MITARVTLLANGVPVRLTLPRSGEYGKSVLIQNLSAEEIQLAGSSATCNDDDSFPIGAGASLGVDLGDNEEVWARTGSGVELTDGLALLVAR